MSSWTAASSDCSRPVNNYVHVKTADLYRPNARLTPERQGYQVLTPFGKLGYSRKEPGATTADVNTPDVDVDDLLTESERQIAASTTLLAAARAFVRRVGTGAVDVDFGDCDESQRLGDTIPRGHGSPKEHTRWESALEALDKKHDLSPDEFDAIESGANGEALLSLEEGYVFGLAVGRQLRSEDAVRGDEDQPGDERRALSAVG